MRILVLSPISPLPIFSGGRTRLFNITRQQARRHELTFVSFWRHDEEWQGLQKLAQDLQIRVIPVAFQSKRRLLRHPGRDALAVARAYGRAWRHGWPAAIPAWEQGAMFRALRQELAARRYDILQVEWPYLASYALQPGMPPAVLITHDVFSVGIQRRAALAHDARLHAQARRWRTYEGMIYARFELVAAMSTQDATFIRERAPDAHIIISPNGVDTQRLTPGVIREDAQQVLFVGSPTHAPNLDAACWLLREIWPPLQRQNPHAKLTLVNLKHPKVQQCAAGQQNVRITGRLPELSAVYGQADVALAPLRAASGTRLKILEAFALGVPVVSTSIGHEGLAVEPGRHLLTADTPAAFAAAIQRALRDVALRRELARNGRLLAEQRYDWVRIVDSLDDAYRMVVHNDTGRNLQSLARQAGRKKE
jgi:glycosyltransferase involved in cell wall biosynthesis